MRWGVRRNASPSESPPSRFRYRTHPDGECVAAAGGVRGFVAECRRRGALRYGRVCSALRKTASSEDCACARRRSSTFHGGGESGNAPTGGDHLISDGSAPHFDRQGTGGRATRMRPPRVHQRYGEPGRAAHVEHEEPGVTRSRRWPARPWPGGATCEPRAAPSTSRSADRRAAELEGRVVLTQHQTAVNNSGTPTCPGPETRRGRFNSIRCSRSWRRRAAIVIKRLNRVYPA